MPREKAHFFKRVPKTHEYIYIHIDREILFRFAGAQLSAKNNPRIFTPIKPRLPRSIVNFITFFAFYYSLTRIPGFSTDSTRITGRKLRRLNIDHDISGIS